MKNTTFKFVLEAGRGIHKTAFDDLADMLSIYTGIIALEYSGKDNVRTLLAKVEFSTPSEVEKLHRKILKFLINYQGISILEVSSTPSDIY
ncbi:hypothetical protein [Calycomorphotria hydatis]|uniref:Uncharacterized protein n=1 Tax=Calycomorphotria hydatis TaxID=2528027 RepID=A0A517T703_9PLAN|nr:hypothetical protein [Calycomorphotria hydatis]QDT64154.1 hypothetical protein V22_13850 [Calycomorphotria hydatis]